MYHRWLITVQAGVMRRWMIKCIQLLLHLIEHLYNLHLLTFPMTSSTCWVVKCSITEDLVDSFWLGSDQSHYYSNDTR